MVVISVVGTSGVGKSFLVKQLAGLEDSPAFFEGEEGVIPPEILAQIFIKEKFVDCFSWFVEKCKRRFERARRISEQGFDCYVDGAVMTSDAVLENEAIELQPILREIVDEIRHLQSDKIVLLTASEEAIRSFIQSRGRPSEQTDTAIARALSVQNAFIRLSQEQENIITIDRTTLDFTKQEDLQYVLRKIRETSKR